MRTVTEAVMLTQGDLRQVFVPGDEVPDEWEIPAEYLFAPAPRGRKPKAEGGADEAPQGEQTDPPKGEES